ncbi:MAG: PHB depolymerase family esterase [bacterium]|nr:PHB depolymerase family esterase [bacterium]
MKKISLILSVVVCSFVCRAQLSQVNNFGSDPGNLNMYTYIPNGITSNAPLVLVLHGCTQDANSYSNESGWNDLADDYKFYVIYAEQPSANNSSKCFNWFENGDQNRGFGEAASLKSMIDYMKNNYSIDVNRVFVTGFSAGGAMSTVMLGAYPEVFASGAVMSGLPYDVATGSTQAFQAMFGNVNLSPSQLGNRVRNGSNHTGTWPTVASFHGTSDFTVYYMNETEIMEQWTNVHGIDQTPEIDDAAYLGNSTVRKREYQDGSGNPLVVTYSFASMGHTIAIDPGSGSTQGGATGSYTKDVDFWSSYYAAEFFGLLGPSLNAPTNTTATASSYSQIDLNWTDNETIETGYIVERSTSSPGPFTTIANLGPNSISYSDNGLSQLTTYYYRISVTDGTSIAAGEIISATTPSDGTPTPPASPSNLSAVSTGQTSIDISWTDNSNNEDSFIIERSQDDESNYSVIATLSSNTTSYTDGGLNGATLYFYRVKAQNGAGASSFSPSTSATTDSESTTITIEQTSGSGILSYFNFNDMGQSFTSIADGEIVSIDVNLVLSISGSTLKIFQGNTVSGTPIYEESGISKSSGWQTITLSNPPAVIDGQQYTFQLTSASIRYSFSNQYSGGNFWYNSISYSVFDAAFRVGISTNSAGVRRELHEDELTELVEENEFNIYPNPAKDIINILSPHPNGLMEIISLDGKVVYKQEFSSDLGSIVIKDLQKGIYHIRMTTYDQINTKKLIIE